MRNRLIVFGIVGAFVASCGSGKHKNEDKAIFKYNEMGAVSSLDPAAASSFENIWVVNQMFNGLVQMDDNLAIQPSIASKWNISEDGLVYTFNLRNDVTFHDNEVFADGKGRKVVAKDFEYSFNRLTDAKVSSALSLLSYTSKSKHADSLAFKAMNDSTFQIRLHTPFAPFLGILTMKYFSVVPKEAVEKYGEDFRRNPVGTGPFVFIRWDEGTRLVLNKNVNYFEFENGSRLPYLDGVSVGFNKDKQTAFLQLLSGEYDMVSGVDAFNATELLNNEGELKPAYQSKFNLQTQPFLKTDYFGIQIDDNLDMVKNSPLRLKALRKAINYAFDREKMIKHLRNNIGTPALAGFIPCGLPSYNPSKVKGYYYNPDKVRELLDEAGYPNGKGLPEIQIYSTENYNQMIEYFQGDLERNNIKVKINIVPPAELKKAVANNQIPFFKKSWVGDYADEENFMNLFYSKNFSPTGFNYFHYSNPAFDALFEKAKVERDEAKRIDLYQQMDRMILDDAPVVPLFYDKVVRLVQKNITGLTSNSMNLLNLKTVKKEIKK